MSAPDQEGGWGAVWTSLTWWMHFGSTMAVPSGLRISVSVGLGFQGASRMFIQCWTVIEDGAGLTTPHDLGIDFLNVLGIHDALITRAFGTP